MEEKVENGARPYLKWAGGKRQLLHEIRKQLPRRFDAYFEPFVGAGAVLFALQPDNAVISDTNGQLILTYRVIRDDVESLITLLREHKAQNSRDYYYRIRGMDREPESFALLPDVEKAARLIFLNKTCYNGLFRVNSRGQFNVPYGRYLNPAVCEEEVLRAVSRYLNAARVEILHADFEETVKSAGPGAFVYFDPPYHSPDNSNFTGYHADGFGEEQQLRLRDAYVRLARQGVKCLLSNSDTPFIRRIYRGYGFHTRIVQASRPINASVAGRGKVSEVLIRSW